MSIEKVKELIETAPEFAQWWKNNRQQIAQEFKGKQHWGRVLFTTNVFYVTVFMPTVIWGSAHFKSNLSALGFDWLWLAIGVTSGGAITLFVLYSAWEKWRCLWPKKAPRPLQQFVNANDFLDDQGDIIPSATPINQKEVLEKICFHLNMGLQVHTTDLLTLKDMDLPDVWWRALELCLQSVETVQQPVHAPQTAQQQLDNAFVEIEQKSQQTRAPKILKV